MAREFRNIDFIDLVSEPRLSLCCFLKKEEEGKGVDGQARSELAVDPQRRMLLRPSALPVLALALPCRWQANNHLLGDLVVCRSPVFRSAIVFSKKAH